MINLYDKIPFETEGQGGPEVTAFFAENGGKCPAIIVLPGGGWGGHSWQEGVPIGEFYKSKGYHAFVLKYRVAPNKYPAPLCDVQRLIKYLRANADSLLVDPNKIFVIGFSAGGHLAALSGVAEDVCLLGDELDAFNHRPNGVLLGYSVIVTERSCAIKICENEKQLENELAVLNKISPQTPPMFIWHTLEDNCVMADESIKLATVLRQNKVSFELHLFPHGPHGLGLAPNNSDVAVWTDLSLKWLEQF